MARVRVTRTTRTATSAQSTTRAVVNRHASNAAGDTISTAPLVKTKLTP